MRSLKVLCPLLALLLIAGCGGADLPELGYVTGNVSLNGQPVPGAGITFIVRTTDPETNAPITLSASAVSDESGAYEAMYQDYRGVPVGEAKIQIDPMSWEVDEDAEGDTPVVVVENWSTKIADKHFAPFKDITVVAGESQVVDLPLDPKQ